MKCLRCGTELVDSWTCPKCGKEDRTVKRIMHTSNAYYNMGLERAQLSDLSGSISALKNSLKYNKMNKDARNLLGLIYFRTGEVIMALSEWVISVNLNPVSNRASDYINEIREDRDRLETLSNSISRYNMALEYLDGGNMDFAVLELKKAISLNPYFLKAYQLMGLIYIHTKQYEPARTALVRALKLDRNNPTTLRYIREVSETTGRKVKRRDVKKTDFTEIKDPNPLVIQGEKKGGMADFNTGRFSFINLLIGIIIGAAAIGLLLIPSIKKTETTRYNNAVADYSSIISSRNRTIANLNARISDMEEEMVLMRSQMEQYSSYTDEGANDDLLLQAAKEYMNGNLRGAGEILSEIDRDKLDHNSSADVYEFLVNECSESVLDSMYVDALTNYRNGLYTEALDGFRKVLNLDPEYGEAVFYTGMTYYDLADRTNARKYFEDYLERFPNGGHAGEANEMLRGME